MKLALAFLIALTCAATADPLPNRSLTPGIVTDLTKEQVCATKWGKDHRAVTPEMKQQVFASYGYPKGDKDQRCPCEIDHLVSRELGGADDVHNLWVQSYRGMWNARMKDRLENRLHKEVCSGKLRLVDAQETIRKDWTKAYTRYFGR